MRASKVRVGMCRRSFLVSTPDGNDVELSGKAGGSVGVTDDLSVYGEVSFVTERNLV